MGWRTRDDVFLRAFFSLLPEYDESTAPIPAPDWPSFVLLFVCWFYVLIYLFLFWVCCLCNLSVLFFFYVCEAVIYVCKLLCETNKMLK